MPAFTGMGAPYWDSQARGLVSGITRGVKKEHFIRASLESIAYQVNDLMEAMQKDMGGKISVLRVDGGASANNFLMQFQANLLNAKVVRPSVVETTALGCAYLAGLKVGYWKDLSDIKENCSIDKVFVNNITKEKRKELIKGWKKAVKRARLS